MDDAMGSGIGITIGEKDLSEFSAFSIFNFEIDSLTIGNRLI